LEDLSARLKAGEPARIKADLLRAEMGKKYTLKREIVYTGLAIEWEMPVSPTCLSYLLFTEFPAISLAGVPASSHLFNWGFEQKSAQTSRPHCRYVIYLEYCIAIECVVYYTGVDTMNDESRIWG